MISFTSTNNNFGVTLQADIYPVNEVEAFTLSRTMMRFVRLIDPKLSLVVVTATLTGETVDLGTLYTDPDGILEVPLRNIVTYAHSQGETSFTIDINLYETDSTTHVDSLSLTFHPRKGISYLDMLAPANKQCDDFSAAFLPEVIVPPNVMFNPDTYAGGAGQGIIAESNLKDRVKDSAWSYSASGVSTAITPAGERDSEIAPPKTADLLIFSDPNYTRVWKLQKCDYCSTFVVIRWTSLTGATRQHYFPVVAFIDGVDKEVSIVEAGNGYDIRKNAFKGVKCRLTGLTPYDCWYYQDLLQASDAHAIVRPSGATWQAQITSMETAAYIEGGMDTTPEGNGFASFEFTVKLRHYDTF